MQNPGEPVRFEEESGQQDANEPIQKNDDTDGNKDDNVESPKDNVESPNDIEEAEEIEWPCGVCGMSVSDDGLECVGCKKWYHGDCSEVLNPIEYRVKQYKCLNCTDKRVSKSSKTKDGAIIKRPGRPPKSRERSVSPKPKERSLSIPRTQAEKRLAKKARSKRSIEDVGSPEKPEKELGASHIKSPNSKKAREEGEVIDMIDSDEGGKTKTDNQKKGEEVGDNDKKTRDIAKKNEGGETRSEKEVKKVENRNIRKNETSQEDRLEENTGKDVEIEKEGKEQEKSKTKITENKARKEEKKLGSNTEIIIKGIEFTKEDIKSLEEGEQLTCTGISLGTTHVEEDLEDIIQNNKILLIRPEIAQIFQHCDRESIEQQKVIHKTKECDWIFYPVNKNRSGEVYGGVH